MDAWDVRRKLEDARTPVIVHHNPNYDITFQEQFRADRRKFDGYRGLVTDYSDFHGLCFKVRFPGCFDTWYEAEECDFQIEDREVPR